jgi:hypothetical protein
LAEKLIVADGGRLYISTDSGSSWSQTQPGGDSSFARETLATDGTYFLAGINTGRLYRGVYSQSTSGSSQQSSDTLSLSHECVAPAPIATPNLFQIDTTSTKVKIYFSPVQSNTNKYVISYGYKPGEMRFGGELSGNSTGVRAYTIESLAPKSTYYVRVRAGNDCASGPWSNEMKFTTSKKGSTHGNRYYKNFAVRVVGSITRYVKF